MFKIEINNGVPEVSAEEIKNHLGQVRLIDVRTPGEYVGELGHIHGAELIELGPDLQMFLENGDRNQEIVFICRSGARSGQATMFSQQIGYEKVYNLKGGMLRWNELQYPAEK